MIDGTAASYPKELTQLVLKPGGGELVWIDLVYIFLFCQMWDGQPCSLLFRPGRAKALIAI